MADLNKLRQLFGSDLSDDELVTAAAKRYGVDPLEVAKEVGHNVGGKWGNRGSAAVDSAQSQLYAAGAEAADAAGLSGVADWARRRRARNVSAADASRQLAHEQGAVMDWRDIRGVGDAAEFVGGLALDTAPQLGATLAGAAAGGLVGGPAGALAGGVAASYPMNYGDVLNNQYEQSGRTEGGTAALLAVPYTAVDALTGVGGKVLRGVGGRLGRQALEEGAENSTKTALSAGSRLDLIGGLKGRAARAGAGMARDGGVEAVGETFQEGMNQLGRMAVDENETFLNERSSRNFIDSAVGGFALGGAIGGVQGGLRSPRRPIDETGGKDLLNESQEEVRALGYSPTAGTPVVFPDGTIALDSEAEMEHRYPGYSPAAQPVPAPEQMGEPEPAATPLTAGVPAGGQDAMAPQADTLPEAPTLSPRVQAIKEQAATKAKELADRDVRASEFGLKGTAAIDAFGELESALHAGQINDSQFAENIALIQARRGGQVKKFLAGLAATNEAVAKNKADTEAADLARVQAQPPTATQLEANATTPENPGTQASPTDSAQAAPQAEGEPSPGAGLIAVLEKQSGKKFTPKLKERIYLAAGMDRDGFVVRSPLTMEQVAQAEATRTGKKVSRQAVFKSLGAVGLTEDSINRAVLAINDTGIENNGVVDESAVDGEGGIADTVTREDTTPTSSDGADIQHMFGETRDEVAGMRVGEPNSDDIVDGESREKQVSDTLRQMLKMGDKLSGAQRTAVQRVLAMPEAKRLAGARKLANDANLFSDDLRPALQELFGEGHTQAAARRDREQAAETAEMDAESDPDQLAEIAAQIERNRLDDEAMADALKADLEGLDSPLEAMLNFEQKGLIFEARDEYTEEKAQSDPAWEALTPEDQARIVKLFDARYPTGDRKPLSAQDYARYTDEVINDAIQRIKAAADRSERRQAGGAAPSAAGRPESEVSGSVDARKTQATGDQPAGVARDQAADRGDRQGVLRTEEQGEALTAEEAATADSLKLSVQGAAGASQEKTRADDNTADRPTGGARADGRRAQGDRETGAQGTRGRRAEDAGTTKARLELSDEPAAFAPSTVASVRAELAGLVPHLGPRVLVVPSPRQLPPSFRARIEEINAAGKRVGGFVVPSEMGDVKRVVAYLIADQINQGDARAVFMHEVGSHMGVDETLTKNGGLEALAAQVMKWSRENKDTLEVRLARRVRQRIENALKVGGVGEDSVYNEYVAYFVEEAVKAGVEPQAKEYRTELDRWMAKLRELVVGVLKKLQANPSTLTAQDYVDLAYGLIEHGAVAKADRAEGRESTPLYQPGSAKFSIAAPGALPAGTPRSVRQAQSQVSRSIGNVAKAAVRMGAFTEDLAKMAEKHLPSVATYMDLMRESSVQRTRQERNIESILDRFSALQAHERGTGPNSVNRFLYDATTSRKWAYKPSYLGDVQVDREMEARFNGMSGAAKQLVRDVFEHGHTTLKQMQASVVDNIRSEYDAAIKAHQDAGDAQAAEKARSEKAKALREYNTLMELGGNWPYAPLKRFGNHVVIGMSQAYLDAEKRGDRAEMKKMETDENHYYVAFAETRREAQRMKEAVEGRFAYADNFEKDESKQFATRDSLSMFNRLRSLVNDSADDALAEKSGKALDRLMSDLYLSLLSEHSARQSERQRRNVAGADLDMMRAFATQGRANAAFMSALNNSSQVQDALDAMRSEADARKPGREERRDHFNELLKRHMMGLDWKPTPFADRALSGSSFWMLLTNPSYTLVNLTQPVVMSLPSMAGKHGYAKASAALMRAYRDVAALMKDGWRISEEDYGRLPADVRSAVNALVDRGRIDISLEQDLGRWRSDQEGPMRHAGNVMDWLRGVNQTAESVNRLVTAIAAVRLEAATGASPERQVAFADKTLIETHGDYSGFNAPRMMRTSLGRMMTQFRKFQLIQLSLYARLLKGSYEELFKGAGPEARWVASKTLAFNMAHMLALGGTLGLPGAQAIGWLLGAVFGDSDEPKDPEQTMRKMIGDKDLADLLLRGVPKLAGVDISGRVGAGGMLSLLPFAEPSLSRDGVESVVTAAMGPFIGGLLPNVAEGLGQMAKGDYYKGLETVMPRGISNAMKGVRLSTEGMTQRNGDVVMSPEDISVLDGFMQAVGLPTNTVTDRSFRAGAKYRTEEHFKARVAEVKKDYTKAYRGNDREAMTQARQQWQDLQATRARYGYKPAPLSDLLKAPSDQIKRERSVAGGVAYTKRTEGVVRNLQNL